MTRAPCYSLIRDRKAGVGALFFLHCLQGFCGKVFGVSIKAPHPFLQTHTQTRSLVAGLFIISWHFPKAYWLVKVYVRACVSGGVLASLLLEGGVKALIDFQTESTVCITWSRGGKPMVT